MRLSAAQAKADGGVGVMKLFSTLELKFRSATGFRCRVVGKAYSSSAELRLLLMLASAEDCRASSMTVQR